jgi:hypothetical protein
LDDHNFYIHFWHSLSFQEDVWRQFFAVRRNAHYRTPLFFVATRSYCGIFVTFLMHRCVGAFQSTPEFGEHYQFVKQCRNAAAID